MTTPAVPPAKTLPVVTGPRALGRALVPLALAFAFAFLIQLVTPAQSYFEKILFDIGIYIILAVSLNIVNGFTGQFSIGHAGFMAIGGYGAGAIVYYGSFRMWGSADVHGPGFGTGAMLFVAACLIGGLLAALAGYLV